MPQRQLARISAIAALGVAAVALLVVLASAGSPYVIHAEFSDAGQLVRGDLVTVGGHQVGSVGKISLTPNGLADVELAVSDQSLAPLRRGAIATIGELSLTGEANRFVSLNPGPGAPIPSGGTLPEAQTRGIVDLDTLLDSLTPRVRGALDGFLESGAYLAPAASQTAGLVRQVAADDGSLSQLVSSTAQVASALALPTTEL
ncbi:MAG TPA: MlaD family protein, partial [Solirubrobacteraceae bacterium]|nr:MlaD family protein [Solirubrobacteraceae bacterium]